MNELTQEQRTQAIIEFNQTMQLVPRMIMNMTDEQKEELAQNIAARKAELGLE